eukprot:4810152-Amphidinium_carterae.1
MLIGQNRNTSFSGGTQSKRCNGDLLALQALQAPLTKGRELACQLARHCASQRLGQSARVGLCTGKPAEPVHAWSLYTSANTHQPHPHSDGHGPMTNSSG